MPTFSPLEENRNTEVLVVGGGLAGLLCAWQMKERGIPCVLLEADRICSGVTRNTTAKITAQHGLIYADLLERFGPEKAKSHWQAGQAAIRQYAALAERVSFDFSWEDSFVYASGSADPLFREGEAMGKLEIPFHFSHQTELPFPVSGAIRMEKQAKCHPLKLAAGLAEGLEIYEHSPVRKLKGKTAITDRGNVRAENIIVATHFPFCNTHGGYFLKQYQHRSYVLALENVRPISGMYWSAEENGLSLRTWGKYLLLGGGGHRTGKQGGGWEALRHWARMYFPQAREVSHWAAQDCMTLDGLPYIGSYGKHTPGVYVATGFNKWGMTNAMTAATVLADRIEGKESSWAQLYSPQRSSIHPRLFANMVQSAVNLLTPTLPRCPHMGCALKWNSQEHSWDCPCHGSRFDRDGRLLDGPATGNREDLPG